MDRLIRGTSKNSRFVVVETTDIVLKSQNIHKCNPVALELMGKLLTASVIMGSNLKQRDLLTLRLTSHGPLKEIVTMCNAKGHVKSSISCLETIDENIRNMKDFLKNGTLSVIKDLGLKKPYTGNVPIQTGKIGDELSYYFYYSEQVPTAISLGVSFDKDYNVQYAGGYMIQLMPNTEDRFIKNLEKKIANIMPMTDLFKNGMSLERIVKLLYEDMESEKYDIFEEYKILEKSPIEYVCNCSREKFYNGLLSLGKNKLIEILEEDKIIETKCHFCNKAYTFTIDSFNKIL